MTEPFTPRSDRPGRWTQQSAGARFAAIAAFLITRDVTFEPFRQMLPGWAYTATVLTGLAVAAIAFGVAKLWLRRLP